MSKKIKKIVAIIVLLAAIAGGLLFYFQLKNKSDSLKKLEESLNVTFIDADNEVITLEYKNGTKPKCEIISSGKEFINQDECFERIDLTVVGERVLTFNLTATDDYGQTASKVIEKKINVVDTVFPIIELSQDTVKVKYKSEYNPADNVVKVFDPVDNLLKLWKNDTPVENGFYSVSKVDTTVSGTQEVTVTALDKNGNETTATFTVEVETPLVTPVVETETDNDSNEVPESPTTGHSDSSRNGIWGKVKVGSYKATLYGNLREYDTTLDDYIDAEDAAPIYSLPSGAMYIPDHNYQGFDQSVSEDTLYLTFPDGTVKELHKVDSHVAASKNSNWYSKDGFDLWYDSRVTLVTQTCLNDDEIYFAFWN